MNSQLGSCGVDAIQMLIQREEGLARHLLCQRAVADTTHGEAEDRVAIGAVQRVEVRHVGLRMSAENGRR